MIAITNNTQKKIDSGIDYLFTLHEYDAEINIDMRIDLWNDRFRHENLVFILVALFTLPE
jgi:hypothetical protein